MEETTTVTVPRKTAVTTALEPSTAPLWRLGGYALLILATLDLVESLIPPDIMNPGWELQFMGTLVERSPVPVLGFVFVFIAEYLRRGRGRRLTAVVLSWVALACGALFLLMIPLMVTNTFRIDNRTAAELNLQLRQQLAQTESIEQALRSATGENLEAILRKLGRPSDTATVETRRLEALDEVAAARTTLQDRAEEARATQKLNLTKRSYKWCAQAIVVGGFLIYLWGAMAWIRKGQR
jgi:hypothetical protein